MTKRLLLCYGTNDFEWQLCASSSRDINDVGVDQWSTYPVKIASCHFLCFWACELPQVSKWNTVTMYWLLTMMEICQMYCHYVMVWKIYDFGLDFALYQILSHNILDPFLKVSKLNRTSINVDMFGIWCIWVPVSGFFYSTQLQYPAVDSFLCLFILWPLLQSSCECLEYLKQSW